jgi:hypothetical protein
MTAGSSSASTCGGSGTGGHDEPERYRLHDCDSHGRRQLDLPLLPQPGAQMIPAAAFLVVLIYVFAVILGPEDQYKELE